MQCARQGFALGLTMLGGKIPSIRVEPLLKLVVDLLEVSSSMKGQVCITSLRVRVQKIIYSFSFFPMSKLSFFVSF